MEIVLVSLVVVVLFVYLVFLIQHELCWEKS